jgi:hypothetical protein
MQTPKVNSWLGWQNFTVNRPYEPYRDWPPKTSADEDETVILGAPVWEAATKGVEHKDLITGEALAPLQHEGLVPNPPTNPTSEV